MASVVVDTHAAIWYFTDFDRLSIAALDAIEERPEPAPCGAMGCCRTGKI